MKKIFCIVNSFKKKISSIQLWRKSFLIICFSLTLIISFSSCTDEDEVGLTILPTADPLNTVFNDTATVNTRLMLEDSLRSDELTIQLLGSDVSTDFGLSTASVYSQVNLEGTPSFGFQPVADSLVLILSYSGYYGDTTGIQTVNVYQLDEDMYIDSSYYSNRNFAYNS